MLDKLVKTAVERLVRQEVDRLDQGGYLKREELERLSRECLAALEGRLEGARGLLAPLLGGLGEQLRAALDVPSRAEVQALREALSRAERGGPVGVAQAAPDAPTPR